MRRALAGVNEAAYTTGPEGGRLPQTSHPDVVAAMLERLEVRPGQRVLEIGTGSGFSTAVLSRLVGADGHVTSVDVDARLTTRAVALLDADKRANVRLVTGDGTRWLRARVFDRVIAWATPVRIPLAWVLQAVPGAVIVSPVHLVPLPRSMGVVRLRRGAAPEQLSADLLMPGGFPETRPEPDEQWAASSHGPSYGVDALLRDLAGQVWWVAAEWLRAHEPSVGTRLLELMLAEGRDAAGHDGAGWPPAVGWARGGRRASGPLAGDERCGDFHAYLMAARPKGLTTAGLGDRGWGVGCSDRGGVALLNPHDPAHVFQAGSPSATRRLAAWVDSWRGRGRPGMAELTPVLHRHRTGWDVRAAL